MAQKQSIDDVDPEKIGTQFTVRDPHPGFEVDPNIINEYGHTHYPKWVAHPTKKRVDVTTTYTGRDQSVANKIETEFPEMVLVKNADEEKALLGKPKAKETKEPVKVEGWDK